MNALAHIVHELVTARTTGPLEEPSTLSAPERLALAELQATLLRPHAPAALRSEPGLEWASPPPLRGPSQP